MRRKRSKRNNQKPVEGGTPSLDASTLKLAAMLEQIAAMDALPLASSPPPRRRRRQCAT
jgi:hypothetical protein